MKEMLKTCATACLIDWRNLLYIRHDLELRGSDFIATLGIDLPN